jgi:CheY-like chemotaxis protein
VLVVEDNLLIAMETEYLVEQCGCAVVGPAANVGDAVGFAGYAGLDGAVLDINLGPEQVWPVADLLEERGVPFIFATAYGSGGMPERFADRTVLNKPLALHRLRQALTEVGTISAY